jgi:hypothetical protein
VTGFGLIAGIALRDMRALCPGFILDMYFSRMIYDAGLRGVDLTKPRTRGGDWD